MNSKLKGIIIGVVVTFFIVAGIGGYGYVTQRMTANEGIEHLNQKEYQKAYEQFDVASQKKTLIWTNQKKDVLFYKGEALYQLERYEDAIEVYDQLIQHGGESRAYSFKAFCYMGLNQPQKALKTCQEGIDEMPQAGDIYCTQYGILAKQQEYQQGLEVLEKALKQKELTNKQDVLFTRISAYEAMFDFKTAYKYAKEYVKTYPKDEQGKKELTFLETR